MYGHFSRCGDVLCEYISKIWGHIMYVVHSQDIGTYSILCKFQAMGTC